MMRFRHVTLALAMVALTGSLVMAQAPEGQRGAPPAPPPEPKNLQVLPKTMTTAQVLPIMRNFSAALGTNDKLAANIKKPADQLTRVQCMTCHRGAAIPTLPPPAPAAGAAPAAPAAPAPPAPGH